MKLYQQWSDLLDQQTDYTYIKGYYEREKNIYQELLANKTTEVEGSVEELSKKWNINPMEVAGFISGINTSLKEKVDVDELEESTYIKMEIDFEKLLWNMYDAKAPWLYELEEWDGIFDQQKREEIKKNHLDAVTAKRDKPGRNDPCPCGSGKKYKKCCGK